MILSRLKLFLLFAMLIVSASHSLLFSQAPDDRRSDPLTIDGSKTPDQIPNQVALEHFLGLLSSLRDLDKDDSRKIQRSYVAFFFKAGCGTNKEDLTISEEEQEKLVQLAQSVRNQRVTSLNNASAIEKDNFFKDLHQDLSSRLGSHLALVLQRHLDLNVKKGIILFSSAGKPQLR